MHDLPSQTLLQQANARPVSGEELEVFGKAAASRYMCGRSPTLNDAVVETVKQAALSPEQVKRVIEFANTAAYLSEFKKEGATHKYISFEGGPASPSEVLKDLNDGGGGTVFDQGSLDYNHPPPDTKTAAARLSEKNLEVMEKAAGWWLLPAAARREVFKELHDPRLYSNLRGMATLESPEERVQAHKQLSTDDHTVLEAMRAGITREKKASDPVEQAFHDMWGTEAEPLPYADPWRDAEDMREKLGTMRDNLNSDLSFLEGEFRDITDQLYGLVKQAAMEGVPLSHILQAWQHVTPGAGFVKAAFSHIGPRLVEDEVMTYDGIGESLTKRASVGVANPEHPIIGTFAGFCSHLTKLAEVRAQRDTCHQEFERIDGFIKKAANLATVAKPGTLEAVKGGLQRMAGSGGLWSKIKGVSRGAGETAGGATKQLGEALLGEGSRAAGIAGKAVHKGVEYAPEIAGAVAAKEMYDRMKYRPSFIAAKNVVQSRIPYTHPYMVREYQLQQNAMM